jgi:hypothetical protein
MSNIKHWFDNEVGEIAAANMYLDAIIDPILDAANANVAFTKLKDLTLSLGEEFSEITWDQAGTSPQNKVLTGQSLELTAMITGATLTQMALTIPGFVTQPTGADGAGIISQVGYNQVDNALPIEIKKVTGDVETTDEGEMLILPVSGIEANPTWTMNGKDQKAYECKFTIYKSSRFTVAAGGNIGAKFYAFTRDYLTAGHVDDADQP